MSNQLVLENLRLRELRIVVEQNKAFFEEFIRVLKTCGYPSLFAFINEPDDAKALAFLKWYFSHAFKSNLCDGVGTPYLRAGASKLGVREDFEQITWVQSAGEPLVL